LTDYFAAGAGFDAPNLYAMLSHVGVMHWARYCAGAGA
jgi:hypothetical protein